MATIVKIEPPKTLLVKHGVCGATIQYELREITEKFHLDYGGGGDTWCYAVCPNCGKEHSWIKRY